MNNDLISRSTLKEDMKSRLSACNEWIEKAKDKETKIRASVVKAFIAEVIMTIDNAPTVDTSDAKYREERDADAYETGFLQGHIEGYLKAEKNYARPQGEFVEKLKDRIRESICNRCPMNNKCVLCEISRVFQIITLTAEDQQGDADMRGGNT